MNTIFTSYGRPAIPFLVAAVPLFLSLLWGCGSPITVPPLSKEDILNLQTTVNSPDKDYRIEPGDAVDINYTFHPEMKQDLVVQPDGKISVALVGEMAVAGLTTDEVEKLLVERTSHRLREPEVVVSVSQFSPKGVYVSGEVGKPGVIPYRKGLTPLQAVIAAGGFLNTANGETVVLVRMGAGDDVVTRQLNLLETLNNGAKEPLALAPNDIVYVPKTGVANANLWVKQHITDMLPVPASFRTAP